MSKPALGRGLGSLLSSRRVDSTESAPSPVRVTPGVAALISGSRETCSTSQRAAGVSPAEEAPARKSDERDVQAVARATRLRWMLVAADAALCGMAAIILLRSPKLRPEEIALCIAAVLLGAWLGCNAWMIGHDQQH